MAAPGKGKHVIVAAQCNDHSAHLAGIPFKRFYTDAWAFARAQLLVSEYYGFDAPNNTWDVYNIEAEALGQKIIFHTDGIPDVDRGDPLIKSPGDLDKIKAPDPFRSGRMPWVHAVNHAYFDLTGRPAKAFFCAPFSLAVNIRGYENLITDMDRDPGFVHRLFGFLCDEVISPYIEAMRREIGNPAALADGSDAWASPPMITLDMMDEFVIPYTRRLRRNNGDKVVTRGNWGEAHSRDPERFMAQKLSCSPGFLSVLDPDLHRIGAAAAKAFARSQNAFVVAGVDATLLLKGPVETIVERIKQYIDVLARDGRGAIYLNQIATETPPAHVHAAVAAVHSYGQLPIAEDLDQVAIALPRRESFNDFLARRGNAVGDTEHAL